MRPAHALTTDAPASIDGAALAERLLHKYADRVTAHVALPARAGRYVPLPADLPAGIARALRARGIERLYSHQGEAWDAARAGRHVVVVTPTASGKSLCYLLPVLADAMAVKSKSLFLFPTSPLVRAKADTPRDRR